MLIISIISKPFLGHNGIIKTNAIGSWLQLHPECEIILYNKDEKIKETASELGVKHVPTPYLPVTPNSQ